MKKSINEKIVAVTGRDNWSTAKVCGLPSLRVSDGPHGLRFVTEEKDGEQIAAESVCSCREGGGEGWERGRATR